MTFDRLRRRMKVIIWMITFVFVSSIFFLAGGSLCVKERNQAEIDRQTREDDDAPIKKAKSKDDLEEDSTTVLATVNLHGQKKTVTEGELNERINLTARFSPYLKGMTPKQLKPIFSKGILENMVNEKLVEIAAEKQNLDLRAAQSEIDAQLAEPQLVTELRRKGIPKEKFVSERLKEARGKKMMDLITEGRQVPEVRITEYYEMKKDEFRDPTTKQIKPLEQVRRQIVDVLRSDIREDAIKEYYEKHRERWRQPDKVVVQHLMLDPRSEARVKTVSVSDAEITTYYNQNKSNFVGEEKVEFRHLFIDPASAAYTDKVKPSDADLQKWYDAHKDSFTREERVQASRILLGFAPGASAEDKKKLEEKAKQLKEELKKGAKFEDLAKANSTDKATAEKGGDMGWVEKGTQSPAFEKAVASLKDGEVSDVVTDDDGYQLIRVAKREPKAPKPFADVQADVKKRYTEEKAEKLASDEIAALRSEVKGKPADFENVAKSKSQAASKGGALTLFLGANKGNKDVDEVGALEYMDKEIQDALNKLKPGEVSDVVRASKGFHVFKLEKKSAPEPKPMADVKDEIVELLKEGKIEQEAVKLSETVQADLKSGTPFAKLVETMSDGKDKDAKGLWDGIVLSGEEKQPIDVKLLADVSPAGLVPDAIVAALNTAAEGQIVGPVTHEKKTHFFHLIKRKEPGYKPLDDELRKEIRFALNPTVTTEEIEAYYREHKAEFKTPPKSKSEWQIFADKESATDALAPIKANADCAKGDKPCPQWDALQPEKHEGDVRNKEIRKVLEDLKPGEFTKEPVKTGLGWIVARLVTREAGGDLPLSAVERQVRERLLTQKKQSLYESWLDELKNQAKISRNPIAAVM
jgi:parvulin-like peptidyl-prolyl isomerase